MHGTCLRHPVYCPDKFLKNIICTSTPTLILHLTVINNISNLKKQYYITHLFYYCLLNISQSFHNKNKLKQTCNWLSLCLRHSASLLIFKYKLKASIFRTTSLTPPDPGGVWRVSVFTLCLTVCCRGERVCSIQIYIHGWW